MEAACTSSEALLQLRENVRAYWGYDSLRPLQQEAMECVLEGRDSLVVLPTGGGKSLCFQAPATCLPGVAVVVSPLISLMKDQVDSLLSCGVPAAYVNSTLSYQERSDVARRVRDGEIKLLYLAPERLVQPRTLEFLVAAKVSLIAIDEAHCISSWGHDFRPEYRQLALLKEVFPDVAIHAYTATATSRVRDDIAAQLHLREPKVLVGSFDRPNLFYRAQRQDGLMSQIRDVLDRHRDESGIIYCISRDKTESVSKTLNEAGYRTLPYHAGLTDQQRRDNQEAFIQEEIDTIVATVAFGMGIDKSNVRYVVHAGMPKSLEAYQQESGRAGRDSLEAECALFFSGSDFRIWQRIIEESTDESRGGALAALTAMYNYCTSVVCRHRAIVNHFGQAAPPACEQGCDVCQGDLDLVEEPLIVGQKILSSVVRQQQRYGAHYTALVLQGSQDGKILSNRHDQLSTYGLLSKETISTIRDWIEQLIGQNYLQRVGEHGVIQLTASGHSLLKGEETPLLLKPNRKTKSRSKAARPTGEKSWEGVDRPLFDELRALSRAKAREAGVPGWMIFNDAALRDMARRRPTTLEGFLQVKGVGRKKCQDFGDEFTSAIACYCREHGVEADLDSE
ncbi:MAG: DNA helicase RecQ [Planctomycetales bacterium]|nr:DNA helicase RecQ [Planctomycetales bacterium]